MKGWTGVFLLPALFVMPACKKAATSATSSVAVDSATVYVAGGLFVEDATGKETVRAICWKNGVPATLAADTFFSYANGIAISGNDVYVVGGLMNGHHVTAPGDHTGSIRKGIAGEGLGHTVFPDHDSRRINGQDIYIAGGTNNTYGNDRAFYCKNGVMASLGYGTYSTGLYANAIAIEAGQGAAY